MHILLRTDETTSMLAIELRNAGYLVTKATDDDTAMLLAAAPVEVDAVIGELSSFTAIRFARRCAESDAAELPLILVSVTPEIVRKAVNAVVLKASANDLVSEIEFALAGAEVPRRSMG